MCCLGFRVQGLGLLGFKGILSGVSIGAMEGSGCKESFLIAPSHHVVPVRDDAMLDGVLQGQHTPS